MWESDLPSRMFDYWALAQRAVGGPIDSLLVCLKPGEKQGTPRSSFRAAGARSALEFRYALVCAWEWSVAELLVGHPALIPFVPYAGDATVAGVEEAIRVAQRLPRRLRLELLAALAVFAQNVFKDVEWSARMTEEVLVENAIYKRGEAAGELKGERKLLTAQLQAKLGDGAPRFVSRLGSCTGEQLASMGRLLVAERSRDELIAALEGLLFDGE